MKKYKIKYVKFVFCHRQHRGDDWAKAQPADYHFGNKFTDTLNIYKYTQNGIAMLFSDYLRDDPRRWNKKAKFTESEASILLLQYLEDQLKSARKEKKRLDKIDAEQKLYVGLPKNIEIKIIGLDYARAVNNRALIHNTEAVKIWRKKVKEIKKSPEYLWEQLLK